METIWLDIVKERLRRNSESPLTKYVQRVNESVIFIKGNTKQKSESISANIPIVYQYKFLNMKCDNRALNLNGSSKVVPLSMILSNKQTTIVGRDDSATKTVDEIHIWQGFSHFEEAYKKYFKGNFINSYLNEMMC